MLYSGADLIRMGALQNERMLNLAARGARPRVVKEVSLDLESDGQKESALRRFARKLNRPGPQPPRIQSVGYALVKNPKKGELLDIYA